jgi:hypothetical protein
VSLIFVASAAASAAVASGAAAGADASVRGPAVVAAAGSAFQISSFLSLGSNGALWTAENKTDACTCNHMHIQLEHIRRIIVFPKVPWQPLVLDSLHKESPYRL